MSSFGPFSSNTSKTTINLKSPRGRYPRGRSHTHSHRGRSGSRSRSRSRGRSASRSRSRSRGRSASPQSTRSFYTASDSPLGSIHRDTPNIAAIQVDSPETENSDTDSPETGTAYTHSDSGSDSSSYSLPTDETCVESQQEQNLTRYVARHILLARQKQASEAPGDRRLTYISLKTLDTEYIYLLVSYLDPETGRNLISYNPALLDRKYQTKSWNFWFDLMIRMQVHLGKDLVQMQEINNREENSALAVVVTLSGHGDCGVKASGHYGYSEKCHLTPEQEFLQSVISTVTIEDPTQKLTILQNTKDLQKRIAVSPQFRKVLETTPGRPNYKSILQTESGPEIIREFWRPLKQLDDLKQRLKRIKSDTSDYVPKIKEATRAHIDQLKEEYKDVLDEIRGELGILDNETYYEELESNRITESTSKPSIKTKEAILNKVYGVYDDEAHPFQVNISLILYYPGTSKPLTLTYTFTMNETDTVDPDDSKRITHFHLSDVFSTFLFIMSLKKQPSFTIFDYTCSKIEKIPGTPDIPGFTDFSTLFGLLKFPGFPGTPGKVGLTTYGGIKQTKNKRKTKKKSKRSKRKTKKLKKARN